MSANETLTFTELFGVPILQVTSKTLSYLLTDLKPEQKQAVQFAYSEVFLRALRNSEYKKAISQFWNICDGKGVRWAVAMTMNKQKNTFNLEKNLEQKDNNSILESTNSLLESANPLLVKSKEPTGHTHQLQCLSLEQKVFSLLLFLYCWLRNFFSLFLILVNYPFPKTKLENILGRDFVYRIFQIAQEKKWVVSIVGGSDLLRANLLAKYPQISFRFWYISADSALMRDQSKTELVLGANFARETKEQLAKLVNFKHKILSRTNLFTEFPDLEAAEKFLETESDLVLVCLGGATGKQEFFIERLLHNPKIKFRAIFGLGAALDHLGAGSQQSKPPRLFVSTGMEWLYRFFFQPKRRFRILDSVLGLFLAVNKETFDNLKHKVK